MVQKGIQAKGSNVPIFTLEIFSNHDFKIPTRKKIRNVPDEGNGKKGKVQIIHPTQMTVVPQNASHVKKSKRTYQVKKGVNHRENDHHHQRFTVEKIEILQHIQGGKEHEPRQIPVGSEVTPVAIKEN